ncbi:helix-turn-helix domain-containing protein [Spirosoma pollinicola]|uniref:Helix-turn-helix domain-containing protein n=2 Tax=Spirosoma pollinicola TaxID=2057025 RepID=A0A2K8YTG7_9BACT|nr:helix-turn-helix domain-containing protein [Spirosoma pollinicola]AUD00874.1 helix-turn-helix domain-containing protein [Spirosoma pollinicola]
MSRPKRCISLSDTEKLTLQEAIKNHPKYEFRRACQALLWSHKGFSAKEVAGHTEVSQHSVGKWLSAWQELGLVGLMRQKGQGRKPILNLTNSLHQQALSRAVTAHYQDAERIKADLQTALGQSMSRDTVKRFLKKMTTTGDASDVQPNPNKMPKLMLMG